MKIFNFSLALLTIFVAPLIHAQSVDRKEMGLVGYYVVPETKQVWYELPLKANLDISELDSRSRDKRYFATLTIEVDASIVGTEIEQIKKMYPGFLMNGGLTSLSESGKTISLGSGVELHFTEAPSNSGYIYAAGTLSLKQGTELIRNLKNGYKPDFKVQAEYKRPIYNTIDSTSLRIGQICSSLNGIRQTISADEVSLGDALETLMISSATALRSIRADQLRAKAITTIVASCLETSSRSRTVDGSVTKLLETPVKVVSVDTREIIRVPLLEVTSEKYSRTAHVRFTWEDLK